MRQGGRPWGSIKPTERQPGAGILSLCSSAIGSFQAFSPSLARRLKQVGPSVMHPTPSGTRAPHQRGKCGEGRPRALGM